MSTAADWLTGIETAGSSRSDKAGLFAQLLGDEAAVAELAEWDNDERRVYYQKIKAALSGAGSLVDLKAAITGAMRRRLARMENEVHGVRLPTGWIIDDGRIYKLTEKDGETHRRLVARQTIAVTGRAVDVDKRTEYVRITWRKGTRARSEIVSRRTIADSRAIVALADGGAPVSSPTASAVVEYLTACEAANEGRAPTALLTRRFGWHGPRGGDDTSWGYLLGHTLYTGSAVIDTTGPEWSPHHVVLEPGDGADGIAASCRQVGTWAGWIEAVRMVEAYPVVMLGLYAALGAPLLGVIGQAPNYIVDWSGGGTQTGKTTILQFAASTLGDPDERSSSLINSWEATGTGAEGLAGVLQHKPFLLDDHARQLDDDAVADMLFRVYSGTGKLRGNVDGTSRAVAKWRCPLLSTGSGRDSSASRRGTNSDPVGVRTALRCR